MFGKLLGKGDGIKILAPVAGEAVSLKEVSDPTFSEEMLGKGIAIKPSGGRIVAPVSGSVAQMFDTGHAVSLVSDDGVEILIHVGLDTVTLKGAHFTIHAHSGDKVKPGDVLMEFDKDAIAAAGLDTITPVVICNTADYKSVEATASGTVNELAEVIAIKK